MADALVSFLLEQLSTVVNLQQFQQELRLMVGVEKEVQKLITTLTAIHAVLHDAEKKQNKDKLVKLWLENLKNITYEIDDVLDKWMTKINRRSQIDQGFDADDDSTDDENAINKKKKKVSSYLHTLCSCFNKVALRHDIGSKIQKIRERLDDIESEKDKYDLLVQIPDKDSEAYRPLKTTSIIDASELYGRDSDKEIILSKLLGESSNETGRTPHIICVIGMGGLGKTTLAQLVYNDHEVQTHFEKTMWVCVSDPFDLTRVAKEIIEKLSGKSSIPANSSKWNDALHHALSDSVKGKRFLLVLDDVWTEDQNEWNPLKLSLKCGAQGSRILVTTRNEGVAKMMEATNEYNLGLLSDEDCWSLLSRIAFVGRKNEEQRVLEEIGFKIAEKCKGLPLVAKALGSLLRLKRTEKEWCGVFESKFWELEGQVKKGLLPALLLSYYDLTSPLKTCFSYCAIFPKDYIIEKDTLIKLWMAQGFLNLKGREDWETIGEEYFTNLAMRSFFQEFSKDYYDGSITSCKMHDLVHDFAQFLTENECYIDAQNSETWLSKASHLTLIRDADKVWSSLSHASIKKIKKLRTLQVLVMEKYHSFAFAPSANLFHHLRCLRVLYLDNVGLERLPSEIEKLIHLRYLNLSQNKKLKELPDSMSNLYNLQTLNLNWCTKLQKLPEGMMGRMINLRHLEIQGTDNLTYIPKGVGKLSSLQTLSKFIVNDTSGSAGCKINELKDLNLLQGHLEITGLGKLETANEASEAKLKEKQHLNGLALNWTESSGGVEEKQEEERMEGVLGSLQPHPNLVDLKIKGYLGSKFPSWMSSSLDSLRSLELDGCSNCTKLPALGKLPSLEDLMISGLDKLRRIGGVEFYGNGTGGGCAYNKKVVAFPKLKTLKISGMSSLEVWNLDDDEEVGLGEIMPCVTYIILQNCQKLKELPAALGKLPSLEGLMISGLDKLRRIGGVEFYGNGTGGGCAYNKKVVAFPKLKTLEISGMSSLEVWNLEDDEEVGLGEIMPCVTYIILQNCQKLKELPAALGKLPSLEGLMISGLDKLRRIGGVEFYGNGTGGGCAYNKKVVSFPKLKTLFIGCMSSLEVWDLEDDEEIMPCVKKITLRDCQKLKELPAALSKLPSLETLRIEAAGDQVTDIIRSDHQFYGVGSSSTSTAGHANQQQQKLTISFPKLKVLEISQMPCLNNLGVAEEEKSSSLGEIITSLQPRHLPCLVELRLDTCPMLKSLPRHLPCLVELRLRKCPMLKSLPRHLPDQLKHLSLGDCRPSLHDHELPNLTYLSFVYSSSSIPCLGLIGIPQFKQLRTLYIDDEDGSMMSIPEDVQHLSLLQELEIRCDSLTTISILKQRCRKDVGEDWHIISHIPKIIINIINYKVIHGV